MGLQTSEPFLRKRFLQFPKIWSCLQYCDLSEFGRALSFTYFTMFASKDKSFKVKLKNQVNLYY